MDSSTCLTPSKTGIFAMFSFLLKLSAISLLLTVSLGQRPPLVNPVELPIATGSRQFHTRFFAQLPPYNGKPSKTQGIVTFGGDIYVTTADSGGWIYKVTTEGVFTQFFNAAEAIELQGREMNTDNKLHGGIHGLAFHPNFQRNGRIYVSAMETVTDPQRPSLTYLWRPDICSPGRINRAESVVIEFQVNRRTMKVNLNSYRQVIRIAMCNSFHPIKQIAFHGTLLYITMGDGSVQSATAGGGQQNDPLGKILRINPLRRRANPYSVPASNPFVGNSSMMDEVYALGLRNPHTLCFSKRGELFAADVGRDNVEEINLIRSGGNYGWSEREGTFVHKLEDGEGILTGVEALPSDDARFGYIYPVAQYGHFGREGALFVGQAIASSCPVENRSMLRGLLLYANFGNTGAVYYSTLAAPALANTGAVYYSTLAALRKSEERKSEEQPVWSNKQHPCYRGKTTGPPSQLTQARTFRPKIFFDHDNNPSTPSVQVENLRAIIQMESQYAHEARVNIRFGVGPEGELVVNPVDRALLQFSHVRPGLWTTVGIGI